MEQRPAKQKTSYKEKRIGGTTYRITSVYTGEKDLKQVLEELAVRSVTTNQGSR
jgi:hypothetical protein